MILVSKNQPVIVLQASVLTPNGAIKTDVSSGTVRVYSVIAGGGETNLLNETSLVEVTTGRWRYVWEPTSIPSGQYVAEFFFVDDDAIESRYFEDLVVRDIAEQSDVEVLKQIATGRWRIYNDQLFLYDSDGETPIVTFNLYDSDGNPTSSDYFERRPL